MAVTHIPHAPQSALVGAVANRDGLSPLLASVDVPPIDRAVVVRAIAGGPDGVGLLEGHSGFVLHALIVGPQGATARDAVTVLHLATYALMRIGASCPMRGLGPEELPTLLLCPPPYLERLLDCFIAPEIVATKFYLPFFLTMLAIVNSPVP